MTVYTGPKEFEGATFVRASFEGATLRFSDVSGVTLRGVDVDVDIDSHDLFFGSLVVNGVDVVPLVDAELNRQFPGRELQKAQTPRGPASRVGGDPAAPHPGDRRLAPRRGPAGAAAVPRDRPGLLAEEREDPWGGGGWRPGVGDCIRVILEEEWAHLRYVRRDITLLQ